MTVDLLKLFVAFGNVIGSIYYFIFDWTMIFVDPLNKLMPSFYDLHCTEDLSFPMKTE